MLPQVNYLVAPGARLAVGSPDTCLTCNFEEGGSSKMAEMLMQVGRGGRDVCAGWGGGRSLTLFSSVSWVTLKVGCS
jgi:hypothetical protein